MKIKTAVLSTIICAACGITGISTASEPAFSNSEDQPMILQEYDRLYIETPVAPDLAMMTVRIFSPDNELVLNTRTKGESVEFLVDANLPDGVYRYETVSVFGNIDLSDRSKHFGGEETLVRKFGGFRVSNGRIIEEAIPKSASDASLIDKVIEGAVNLAGMTLDLFVSSAHAAAINTAPGGQIVMEDEFPIFYFLYGPDNSINDGLELWLLSAYQGANPAQGDFNIYDRSSDLNILTFEQGTQTQNSINVDSDGDIHWANGGMNFDKELSALSLGTSLIRRDMTISSLDPGIDLFDESFNDSMGLTYDGFNFGIRNFVGDQVVKVSYNAPEDSLQIQENGWAGFGTSAPVAPLEVRRSDGAAQVLVDEKSAVNAARDVFRGKNNGPTLFSLKDTSTSRTWAFTVLPEGFTMSRQGSGAKEFLIKNNGDATLQGTLTQLSDVNSKQDIKPVDSDNILAKIAQLEISEWSYKDSPKNRHIGPMSQDFYKAFGLGGKAGVKGISTLDSSGIALAAIQALIKDNDSLKAQNEEFKAQNEVLNERLGVLERQQVEVQAVMMKVLENQAPQSVLTSTVLN